MRLLRSFVDKVTTPEPTPTKYFSPEDDEYIRYLQQERMASERAMRESGRDEDWLDRSVVSRFRGRPSDGGKG